MRKNYALIGNNISYSESANFFNSKFKKENIDAKYKILDLPDLTNLRNIILKEKLSGFNVTIPFKIDIIPLLDELAPKIREIGAVNVVKVSDDGKLIGYNTDMSAFSCAIKPFLKDNYKKALVLGSGGAAKAVLYALRKLNIETLNVIRGNIENDRQKINYRDLKKMHIDYCDIIVNCTPLGTHPNINNCVDIPYSFIQERHFLFDLVYNPKQTLFLTKGIEQGAFGVGGWEMFVHQAEKSWEIWNSELV